MLVASTCIPNEYSTCYIVHGNKRNTVFENKSNETARSGKRREKRKYNLLKNTTAGILSVEISFDELK